MREQTIDLMAGCFIDERGNIRRSKDYVHTKKNVDGKTGASIPKEFQSTYAKCKRRMDARLSVFRSQVSLFTNELVSLSGNSIGLPNSRSLMDQTRPELGIPAQANWTQQIITTRNSMFVNLDLGFQLMVTKSNFKTDIARELIQDYFDNLIRDTDLTYKCSQLKLIVDVCGWAYMLYNPWTDEFDVCAPWNVGVGYPDFLADEYRDALILKPDFPITKLGKYISIKDVPEKSPLWSKLRNPGSKDFVRLELLFSNFERKRIVMIDGQCHGVEDWSPPMAPIVRLTSGYPMEGTIVSVLDKLAPLQNDYNACAKKKSNQLKLYGGPMLVVSGSAIPEMNSFDDEEMKYLRIDSDHIPSEIIQTINPTPMDAELSAEMERIKANMFEIGGLAQIEGDLERYRQIGAIIAIQQIHEAAFQSEFTILNTCLQRLVRTLVTCKVALFPNKKLIPSDERYPFTWTDLRDLLDGINLTFIPVHRNTHDGSANEDDAGINEMELTRNACWKFVVGVVETGEMPKETPPHLERTTLKNLVMTRIVSSYQAGDDPQVMDRLNGLLRLIFDEEMDRGELRPYLDEIMRQKAA